MKAATRATALIPSRVGFEDFLERVGALVSGLVTYEFVLRELEAGNE